MLKNTVDDLKDEILQLKKQLTNAKNENQLLKVKIRKLDDELKKRLKQLHVYEECNKSKLDKRLIASRNANTIFSLNLKIEQLEKALFEKDLRLKKVENEAFLAKMYASKFAEKYTNFNRSSNVRNVYTREQESSRHSEPLYSRREQRTKRSHSLTPRPNLRQIETDTFRNAEKIKEINLQYERLTRDNLLNILSNLNSTKVQPVAKRTKTDDDKNISALYNYTEKMSQELEELRDTVTKMKSCQDIKIQSKSLENVLDSQSDIVEEIDNYDTDFDNYLEQ